MTSYLSALRRTKRAARHGKTACRQAESARERVGFGNASLRQNLSILCPAFFHCSDNSNQTRAAPRRGSHGRFTMPRMRSGLCTDLFRKGTRQAGPEFMANRIHVMPQRDRIAGIPVAINKLIVRF